MKRLPVKHYEHLYEVDENGEIYSLERNILGRDGTMYPFKAKQKNKVLHNTGYFQVNLWCNNGGSTWYVHRIVATAFIPNPLNKPEVNHIDGNKQNNHVSNLEWVTSSENSQHAVDTKLRVYTNRLTQNEFIECLSAVIEGESYFSLSKRVPYKVPYLSTKLRKIARDIGVEDLLNESLLLQKQKRARINGAKHNK